MLGNVCFTAWYPSYYGKEVLGDISGNSTKGNSAGGGGSGGSSEDGAVKSTRRDRDNPPMLDRLYVCPCCFKYSKELVTWWEHVRACERRGYVPGDKIYVHPKGTRTERVPAGSGHGKAGRKKKGDVNSNEKMVDTIVRDEGEWSLWEVDGEKEVVSIPTSNLSRSVI